jgi:hypothetical protein
VSEVSSGNEGTELRERPLGEVARDLTRDLSLLVRQELELAKSEMTKKGRVAAPGLGMIGGAVVVGLTAAGCAPLCPLLGPFSLRSAPSLRRSL